MTKTNRRLTAELLELAGRMHKSGTMDTATYEKIVMRSRGRKPAGKAAKPARRRRSRDF